MWFVATLLLLLPPSSSAAAVRSCKLNTGRRSGESNINNRGSCWWIFIPNTTGSNYGINRARQLRRLRTTQILDRVSTGLLKPRRWRWLPSPLSVHFFPRRIFVWQSGTDRKRFRLKCCKTFDDSEHSGPYSLSVFRNFGYINKGWIACTNALCIAYPLSGKEVLEERPIPKTLRLCGLLI